ncbi:Ppx/GppA phosphatase family protein [Mobilicoccus massiliensis]|uniref:Ppx/GppA phosphatase family protein n=1 Tax=Mobilicoccus massiliensis TaxID=1522310 RepID=UPI00058C972C|nr:exopolyphosphatase [Mobilicoccus massiliensis]
MRVGVVDCGTNSLRLLVADVEGARLREVSRHNEIVRLGQGVDATGRINADAMTRAFAVLDGYADVCRDAGVERMRFAATSASRDAANAAVFFEGVRARLAGVEPEVITGLEEADLSFVGATSALVGAGARPSDAGGTHAGVETPGLGRTIVADLGGGSTEFVLGRADPAEIAAESSISVDLGSVRLTERLLHGDPPDHDTIALAAREVDARLDEAESAVPFTGVDTLVGVAGTVTTLTAHALRLDSYDRTRIDGARVDVGVMLGACDDMLYAPTSRRERMPYLHPGRIDVIGAGALIWSRIVRRLVIASPDVVLRTSESDILDGMALRLA